MGPVRTWEEDSCRDEEIPLTGVARASKSFLEQVDHLQTYRTPLVFLIHNLSYVSQFDHMKKIFMITFTCKKHKGVTQTKREELEGI